MTGVLELREVFVLAPGGERQVRMIELKKEDRFRLSDLDGQQFQAASDGYLNGDGIGTVEVEEIPA